MKATTVKVISKETGEELTAVYSPTAVGNMRYWILGKPYTDRKFDKLFKVKKEEE